MVNDEAMETAVRRYEIIAPLLMPSLDEAEKRRIRSEIVEREEISERTLRRYTASYRDYGFEGLKPKERCDAGEAKAVTEDILHRAAEIKKELPERSVRRVIRILEGEGIAAKGEISRSTLSRHLKEMGLSTSDLKALKDNGRASKRFVRSGRNTLWQADVKYGPYIPGENGRKKRTYLIAFIDDATRFVTHAEFYDNQRLPILEDGFRKAILKYGKPDSVYVDNGKIFVSRWFRIACARLGIRHLNTKSYCPQSKVKVERYNGTANEFMQEVSLEKIKDLSELNQKFRIWLDEGYNNRPHSSIDENTPMQAYSKDIKKVRFATPEECRDAFLWEDTRKVDKTGCFKLMSIEYEAGIEFIGKKIDARYDPFDLNSIEVWHNGERQKIVSPIKIPEFCGKTEDPQVPSTATHSRLLKVLEEENAKRRKQKMGILSFRSMKEGDSNV